MAYSRGDGGRLLAVDAILAEAADLVALQQIARLNTAHLADDSALPSNLESRFRKAAQKEYSPPQVHPPVTTVPAVQEEDEEKDLERLFGSGRGRPTLRERNRGRGDSLSPPHQACCFGFSSPRKSLQRTPTRSKKSHAGEGDLDDVLGVGDVCEWGDENRRMVTELKEQQQVKLSRETTKMARWVKQASARMTHTVAIEALTTCSATVTTTNSSEQNHCFACLP